MRVVVVASGELGSGDAQALDGADLVIAADGGAHLLDGMGRRPDLLIGDLDSIDPALVDRLADGGTRVERHPADKDASDTELALCAAVAAGADSIVLLGALGGDRLDHELANLLLLADPALDGREVEVRRGGTTVRLLRPGRPLALRGVPGDLVTLLPLGGDADGVRSDGLRWALRDATLPAGGSRGLSNEIVAAPASVQLDRGSLLVVETRAGGAS